MKACSHINPYLSVCVCVCVLVCVYQIQIEEESCGACVVVLSVCVRVVNVYEVCFI